MISLKIAKHYQIFKLFANLFKQGVEALLQGELDFRYNKNKKRQIEQKNSRNGYYDKTVKTENLGNILLYPRDYLLNLKLFQKGNAV